MAPTNHVTVGIVGGGVAGLTLARALEQLGISYVLWEAYDEIAPHAGASIGLLPNGLRILDQLGIVDEVEKHAAPHHSWEHRDSDGTLYNTLTVNKMYREAFGYPSFLMERQRFLEIMYNSIEDKTTIVTSKRVASVKNLDTGAIITAVDGTQVSCEVVAGADGVRSVVRREIEASLPNIVKTPGNFSTKYACVFGMSTPLPGIGGGRYFTVYHDEVSVLIFTGMGGTLYWFLFQELPKPIEYDLTKKYSAEEIEAVAAKVAEFSVTDGVKFSDIYRNKVAAVKTSLEEGIADEWFCGRMFVLGDSAHKVVPHTAMGANQAIESTACFVNQLLNLRKQLGGTLLNNIPTSSVEACLKLYAEKRRDRVIEVMQQANFVCRSHLKAVEGFVLALPEVTDDMMLQKMVSVLSTSEKLENWSRTTRREVF